MLPHYTDSKILHHFHPHFNFHLKETPAIYLGNLIRTFSQALIGIFIPIYILELRNTPLLHENELVSGIIWVLLYYIVHSAAILLLTQPLSNLIFGKLNFKGSIILGNLTLALAIGVLSMAEKSAGYIILGGFLAAIPSTFYWIPFHILFIEKAHSADGKYGRNFGIRIVLDKLSGAAGPFLGGIIIVTLGFQALFTAGIALLFAAAIPIVFSIHSITHPQYNVFKIFYEWIKDPVYKNDTIAIGSLGIESIIFGIFSPILIYSLTSNLTELGAITSVSLALSAAAAFGIGKLIDLKGPKLIHRAGTIIDAVLYIPRAFIVVPGVLYAIDILDRLNGSLFAIPFYSTMYEHAHRKNKEAEFIIYRNLIQHISILLILILILLLILSIGHWKWVFLVASVASIFTYWIHEDPRS